RAMAAPHDGAFLFPGIGANPLEMRMGPAGAPQGRLRAAEGAALGRWCLAANAAQAAGGVMLGLELPNHLPLISGEIVGIRHRAGFGPAYVALKPRRDVHPYSLKCTGEDSCTAAVTAVILVPTPVVVAAVTPSSK